MKDSRSRQWHDAFRAFNEEVAALTADLSPDTFNCQPEAGAWSVGQCLDHLVETGRPLVPRLEAALDRSETTTRAPRLGLRDRLFVWTMEPGGRLKMPSPGAYRPAQDPLNPTRTASAFEALQDDLAACAERAEGRDWSGVVVASPASRFLRLSAGGWLAGTLAHQRRHLRQAWAVREAVEG